MSIEGGDSLEASMGDGFDSETLVLYMGKNLFAKVYQMYIFCISPSNVHLKC